MLLDTFHVSVHNPCLWAIGAACRAFAPAFLDRSTSLRGAAHPILENVMTVIDKRNQEIWFLTGSQHLYGEDTLKKVARNSHQVAEALGLAAGFPANVVWKPV